MTLAPGVRLGAYEILAPLGAGGMGEVYRARDTTLGRDVALKTLPDAFTHDSERLARFEREARVLAALNHPNIATIHGFEEAGGTRFLVLELVEGATLADRLAQGALPLEEALRLAIQIADALDAAHEKGVIHRDLKPANVKVTPDGRVKVLDFGLAKALDGEAASAEAGLSQSPTLSLAATQQGVILGTAAYMSPEQAKGRAVDRQTDIWAFGCVLYELLTGRAVVTGDDVSEILASVIKGQVEIDRLPAETPPRLRELLARCLRKDPKQRFRDIGDVRYELERIAADPAGARDAPLDARPGRTRAWIAAIALTAVVSTLATWWLGRSSTEPQPLVRLTAAHPGAEIVQSPLDADVALSPDGRRLAYVAISEGLAAAGCAPVTGCGGRLYVRDLDQLAPRLLAESARSPFFSPDGQWVGFVNDRDRLLYRVAVTGGAPIRIGPLPAPRNPRGASWGADGTIVFAVVGGTVEGPGLWSIPASGGEPTALTTPDATRGEGQHLYPEILPDGRTVLFTISGAMVDGSLSFEGSRIAILDRETAQITVLLHGGHSARYAASGHLVFMADERLQAVAFDLERRTVRGTPAPVLDGVAWKGTGAVSFGLSPTGTLAYVPGAGVDPELRPTLTWVDAGGREEPFPAEPRRYREPRLSPDGARVAVSTSDHVWIHELARGTFLRLTGDTGFKTSPAWTPDGTRVAYAVSGRADGPGIFWRAADGSGSEQRLTTGDQHFPDSWTPDGRHLLFTDLTGGLSGTDSPDLGRVTPGDTPSVEPLLASPAREQHGQVSPDGRWLAYQSDETGRMEIYIRSFPDVDGPRWALSTNGGVNPVWAPDGAALYYRERLVMMAVAAGDGAPSTWQRPERLFDVAGAYTFSDDPRHFDVARDGRFLMVKPPRAGRVASVVPSADDATGRTPGAGPREIVVVLNWLDELTRLVTTAGR